MRGGRLLPALGALSASLMVRPVKVAADHSGAGPVSSKPSGKNLQAR